LVADGTLATPVEATYSLADHREALATLPKTTAPARCSSLSKESSDDPRDHAK